MQNCEVAQALPAQPAANNYQELLSHQLEITIHSSSCKVKMKSSKPISFLLTICSFLKALVNNANLSACTLCTEPHHFTQLCFADTTMNRIQQTALISLLDGYTFQWTTTGHQQMVFSLCKFFKFDEDYLLPIFVNSLRPEYAQFNTYCYLELVYEMAEARYDVLASFLLEYFNRYSLAQFISPSLLYRSRSLQEFLTSARSLPNGVALRRRHLISAIHTER
ncbi:hypothetical protein OS493_022793 [Desmophyllum pertusum]|uniref:Uncharacterized protein n=1 Tax=Desmophyllum pertusum TaxID=174260 RepID=A0A9X0A0R4_9CNID|nr:hypothetical protein OS493_022793 [Desmophyllum pertusum]